MSGRYSRNKGARIERELVRLLRERGRAAERIPLSGAAGGRFSSDISIPVMGDDWRVEVKARGHGFNQLYAWLAGSDALIVKADRKRPLLVIDLERALSILEAAESARLPIRKAA